MSGAIFICDVDNCISDDSHRIHMIPNVARVYGKLAKPIFEHSHHLLKPRDKLVDEDFHEYHMNCIFDEPKNLDLLYENGEIWMVTAMPQQYRGLRWWWLNQHLTAPMKRRVKLLMRMTGDHSHSEELKVRLLKQQFDADHRDPSEVVMAIDDRQGVLDAYEKEFNFPTKRIAINE